MLEDESIIQCGPGNVANICIKEDYTTALLLMVVIYRAVLSQEGALVPYMVYLRWKFWVGILVSTLCYSCI